MMVVLGPTLAFPPLQVFGSMEWSLELSLESSILEAEVFWSTEWTIKPKPSRLG